MTSSSTNTRGTDHRMLRAADETALASFEIIDVLVVSPLPVNVRRWTVALHDSCGVHQGG
jgi:hypothetical protein